MLAQEDAERSLVHALLRRSTEQEDGVLTRISQVPPSLAPEDFGNPKWQLLFSIILSNADDGRSTSVTLASQQAELDEFSLIQGAESVDPTAIDIYAESVAFWSQRREINNALKDAQKASELQDPWVAANQIIERISAIRADDEAERIGTTLQRIRVGRDELMRMQDDMKSGRPRFQFPLPTLNKAIPWVLPGSIVLLTGMSKMGKSSLACQLADNNARNGLHGLYFHYEDTPAKLYLRRVARNMAIVSRRKRGSNVPSYSRMLGQHGTLTDNELVSVYESEEIIRTEIGDRLTEIYAAGWPISRAIRTWRRLDLRARAAGHPLDFVVFDYLNKFEFTTKELQTRGLASCYAQAVELIKQTAESTGAIAVVVQQENDEGLPFESRSAWHKSQIWLKIDRKIDGGLVQPTGEVIIKSANDAATGSVPVKFLGQWMLFVEDHDHEPAREAGQSAER